MALEHVSDTQLNNASVIERLDNVAFANYRQKKAPEFVTRLARATERLQRDGDKIVSRLEESVTQYSNSLADLILKVPQMVEALAGERAAIIRLEDLKFYRDSGQYDPQVLSWNERENAKPGYSSRHKGPKPGWTNDQAHRHFVDLFSDSIREK